MKVINETVATIMILFAAFLALRIVQACRNDPIDRESYIVGGDKATPNEFPWIVALEFTFIGDISQSLDICAGSIVSSEWVVTAGHCFLMFEHGRETDRWSVIAGAHDLSKYEPTVQKMAVKTIYVHEHYYGSIASHTNDIGLIKIVGQFKLDGVTVAPIALPEEDDYYAFDCQMCVVMGWGMTDKGRPDVLHKANLPTERLLFCQLFYDDLSLLPGHMCAGATYIAERICHGDSGASLACYKNSQPVLAGIASFGDNCSTANPGVFTRVSYYRYWIDDRIAPVQRRRDTSSDDTE